MPFLSDVNERLFLSVNEFARDTAWLHGPAVALAKYGVVLFAVLLLGAAYFYGRSSARALAAAVWAGAATLLAVAINQPIGDAVGEHRPYVASRWSGAGRASSRGVIASLGSSGGPHLADPPT